MTTTGSRRALAQRGVEAGCQPWGHGLQGLQGLVGVTALGTVPGGG